jgi:hypothetical protein
MRIKTDNPTIINKTDNFLPSGYPSAIECNLAFESGSITTLK